MKNRTLIATVTAMSLITAAAFAHGGATGIVKERMDGMMAMGKALGSVANIFKGEAKYDVGNIEAAAAIIKEHALEIEKLFPDTHDSRKGKGTEALPSIWENQDDFNAIARELAKRSDEMAEVAKTNDEAQLKASFANLAKTCSGCHRDYRKSKN